MSKPKSDETDSVKGSEFTQEEFAAKFLLRALEELRLADDTITGEDLHTFADELRKDMGLMIGNKKFLRELLYVSDQVDFLYRKEQRKTVPLKNVCTICGADRPVGVVQPATASRVRRSARLTSSVFASWLACEHERCSFRLAASHPGSY